MELSEKQIGTLILFMQNGFNDRYKIKTLARKSGIKHLNNIDDEYKLLLSLSSELEKLNK